MILRRGGIKWKMKVKAWFRGNEPLEITDAEREKERERVKETETEREGERERG